MELLDIKPKVQEILEQNSAGPINESDYDKNFASEFDSLDTVEIVMSLEDEFNIEIPDEDWEEAFNESDKVLSVNTISEFVKKQIG